MNTTGLRAGALACALLTTTCLTAPAWAQSSAPPVAHNIDGNGVDIVLGTFNFSQSLLSIGPSGQNGLDYVRMLSGGAWIDNATGGVFQNGADIFVSIGDTSATFTFSGGFNLFNSGSYTPKRADGSTLTRSGGTFTYTNAAGIVVRATAEIGSNGRIVAGTGRLVDLRYPSGMLVSFNYRTVSLCDGADCTSYYRLQSATNSANYQLHFTYSQDTLDNADAFEAWHHLVSVQAINTAVESCNPLADHCTLTGSWPSVAFGTSGSDETVTLPDSNVWRFTPSANGPSAIYRPGSTSADVSVSYDSSDRVSALTDAAGTWSYSYSDSGSTRTTTVTGPLSARRVVTSDVGHETVTADEDALGHTTGYQYDSSDRLTQVTAPEGNYVAFTYDGRGNVTQTQFVPKTGSGLSTVTESASYDSSCGNALTCNQPNSITDALGNVTDYTYSSSHGGVLTVTAPAPSTGAVRPQTRLSYTQVTAVTAQPVYLLTGVSACQTTSSCSGGSDEAKSTISYGTANLLPTGASRGNGSGTLTATVAATYDDIGNLGTVDGPLSGTADTVRYRYNALRQVVGVIGPDPDGAGSLKYRSVRTSYDAAGLPSAVEQGTVDSQSDGDWASMTVLEGAAVERDSLGRPVVQRLVSGGTTYALTQTSYDARGRVQCAAQRMNPSEFATASLPSDACTLDTQGSYGPDRVTKTSYDLVDRPSLVQTGYGVSGVQADEAATTYSINGQVATVTDAEGNMTTFEYDGFDRLRNTRMPSPTTDGVSAPTSGTGADYEQLSYDAAGNVTSRRLRDGTSIGYSYDHLGRLTGRDLPATAWYQLDRFFAYDNLGRLTYANGNSEFMLAYDALGRLIGETSPFGTTGYQYDLAGRRTRITWRDDFYVAYDYDLAGETTAIRENGAMSGAGMLATYAYDDRGRRTGVGLGNGTSASYGYDAVDRLTGLSHNLNGTTNDVAYSYAYNPASEIVSRTNDNTAYSYTGYANANIADTVNGLNQLTATGSTSFSHDANGNVSAIGATAYAYTAENRLVSRTDASYQEMMDDSLDRLFRYYDGSANRWFGYDATTDQAIAEYDASGIARRYVPGPGQDEPILWYEGSGTSDRRWLHADERGSVVAISDGSGNLSGSLNRYDEYGNPQGSLNGRFGYTGQMWLPEFGMYYYRARIYNPAIGPRFMQADPIGFGGGMNLYAYVGNDPVNFTDPLGLEPPCVDPNCGTVTGPRNGEPMDFGAYGFGGSHMMNQGPTVSERQEGPNAVHPCTNEVGPDCGGVLGRRGATGDAYFYLYHGRYIRDPNYRTSRYARWVDVGFGVLVIGPGVVALGAELAPTTGVALEAGEYSLTDTVAGHLTERSYMNSPSMVRWIQEVGVAEPDPGGVPGAIRWVAPGTFQGSRGAFEMVMDPATRIVFHFLFRGF